MQSFIYVNSLYASVVAKFQFSQTTFNVSEDSGSVSVCLELVTGILTVDVQVDLMIISDGE